MITGYAWGSEGISERRRDKCGQGKVDVNKGPDHAFD